MAEAGTKHCCLGSPPQEFGYLTRYLDIWVPGHGSVASDLRLAASFGGSIAGQQQR